MDDQMNQNPGNPAPTDQNPVGGMQPDPAQNWQPTQNPGMQTPPPADPNAGGMPQPDPSQQWQPTPPVEPAQPVEPNPAPAMPGMDQPAPVADQGGQPVAPTNTWDNGSQGDQGTNQGGM